MALVVSYDGFGVVANADAISDTAGGTWAELGGGTIGVNPDVYLYGSASIGSKYASKSGFTYFTATTALNFTTTEAGQYIYMWINIQSASAFQILANDGFHIVVGSDTSNYYKFPIVGSDDANGWAGGWKLFVCDITLGQVVGTPDDTAINTFGVWIDTIVSVRADSIFQSQIMCAKGLKVEGTSSVMYDDIVLWCEDYINRAAGMFQSRGQTYYSLGSLTVHSDTANTVVSSDGNNVEYEKSEFHNGTIWTTSYPTTANLMTIEATGGNTCGLTDYNIGTSGNDSNRVALNTSTATSYIKNGGYIKYLSTLNSIAGHEFNSVVFSLYNARTLGAEPYSACTFDGSASTTLTASSNFANANTMNGVSGIDSIITPDLAYSSTTKINSSGANHGTNLTAQAASMTFNNITTNFDTGATGSPITPTATGNEDIYITATSASDITINVASGATTPSVRVAASFTGAVNVVSGGVSIKVVVKGEDGVEIPNALVYIDEDLEVAGSIANTTTDINGEVNTSYTGAALSATLRVRLYGYYAYLAAIDLTGDSTTNVRFVVHPQQT